MTPPIDLRPDHAKIVHDIIAWHLPGGVSVRVFGSRAKWTAKPHSDLDLAVKGKGPLPRAVLSDLSEAFSESDLPFRVDVVDWHSVAPSFQTVIDRDGKAIGWQTAPLYDCLESLIDYRGKSPKKSATGIPVLSAKVVKTTGLLRPIEQTIAPDYYPKWMTRGLPRPGDVVMTTEAPLGEVIQLDEETSKFALGQRIVCMRGKAGKLDNTFLRYLLTSPKQQEILASYSTGTTVLGISQKALRSIPISYPQFDEQERIGTLLAALDDKIELNRRMNATLERQAQAIFRDWFVDFGPVRRKQAGEADPVAIMGDLAPAHVAHVAALFPDAFDDDGFPVGWKPGALGDIAQAIGETVNPSLLSPETPYFGLEHLPRCSITLDDWGQAASVNSNKAKFKRGQVLFGKLRPYFHKVGIAPLDGVCSTDIVVMDGKRLIDRPFVVSCVSSKSFVDYTDQGSTGTKMPRTSWGQMKKYPIAISPELVREAYSQIVQPMHDKIIAAVHERQALAETRDYLLPRLMSGTVRVVPQDRAA